MKEQYIPLSDLQCRPPTTAAPGMQLFWFENHRVLDMGEDHENKLESGPRDVSLPFSPTKLRIITQEHQPRTRSPPLIFCTMHVFRSSLFVHRSAHEPHLLCFPELNAIVLFLCSSPLSRLSSSPSTN